MPVLPAPFKVRAGVALWHPEDSDALPKSQQPGPTSPAQPSLRSIGCSTQQQGQVWN